MSFEISIESELKQSHKQLSELEKQAYPKDIAKTLNRLTYSNSKRLFTSLALKLI